MRRALIIGLGVLVAVALVGGLVWATRSGDGSRTTSPTTRSGDGSPSTSPTTALPDAPPVGPAAPTGPPPPGLKAPIVGLLDRQGEPVPGYGLAGWVVKTSWAELQPAAGGPIASPNAIDAAVARARSLGLVLKLRVYAGTQAPAWAKQIGGAPLPLVDPASGVTETVGRFWTDAFGQAYADFQARLAARYDGVAEIRETVVSRCTTLFAEPFLRQTGAGDNAASFAAAGLDDAADLRCLKGQVDAHAVWVRTRSDLAVNPYQSVANGARRGDLAVPEQVMRYCRQRLGPRCVLENNSLRAGPSTPYQKLYEVMKALGRPLAFQTASGDKVGDLATAVSFAADLGASSVELPMTYRETAAADLSQLLAPARARLAP